MSIVWDGVTKSSTVNNEYKIVRNALADAAKISNWTKVFEILNSEAAHVNSWRLDGKSFYTPLHQAAFGNAPIDIVEKLIALGAWRTLQNSKGERPVDIAKQKEYMNLTKILEPEYKHKVPFDILIKIQNHFHETIRERSTRLVKEENLRLPELVVLLELEMPEMWFPVPGMYGGFSFRLKTNGANSKLISESWCRVVGGSDERHEITASESTLVRQGSV